MRQHQARAGHRGGGRPRSRAPGAASTDVEGLRGAGGGAALAAAPAEVRLAADAVTGRFADGGTADELTRWFPG